MNTTLPSSVPPPRLRTIAKGTREPRAVAADPERAQNGDRPVANDRIYGENLALMLVLAPDPRPIAYSLETAARLAEMHPEMLRYYCRLGLFGAGREEPAEEISFDDEALQELYRFEHYRVRHGIDRQTLRLICGLRREVAYWKNKVNALEHS